MAVYLVQHGKCYSKEIHQDRPLTEEGAADTRRIADVAKNYGVIVSKIFYSGKTRALETSEIIADLLKPANGVEAIKGIDPNDDVKLFAEKGIESDNRMLVGHQPFMGKLASFLITGSDDIPVFKLQNSGILCLEKNAENGKWIIKWAIMPNID